MIIPWLLHHYLYVSFPNGVAISYLVGGKHTKNMEHHHFSWIIPLFLWSFSIAMSPGLHDDQIPGHASGGIARTRWYHYPDPERLAEHLHED